jgi:hypothetical protein
MALNKKTMRVQMDRTAILQQATQPIDAPPADPAEDQAAPVLLDLRQPAPPAVAAPSRTAAATPKPAAKRETKAAVHEPAPDRAATSQSVSVLLTAEQWEWARAEAERRGIAQRYVLLSAVDRNRKAVAEHFSTSVQESASLFRWTGEPKDVEGKKVTRPVRIPPAEREILQRLVEEAAAPSMSMYLRIAVDIEMRGQGAK